MPDFDEVTTIAIEAGEAIMEVYDRGDEIDIKTKDDESPLTEADLAANDVITARLLAIEPNIPVVSEEGNVGNPAEAPYCWLVDPLDGTKEFIKRNGMFTVNIALMRKAGIALPDDALGMSSAGGNHFVEELEINGER